MQWINEQNLGTWASRTDARALMPDMVADLIRATVCVADRYRFRFPGGDAGQLRGWDGDLETANAIGLVPEGKSKWEFGVGAGVAKATADYNKRTAKTTPEVMAENTLVLVNLEGWNTPREMLTQWEDERRKEGLWKNVKYIDAVTLVHWLDENPAVAARYARDVLGLAPQEGALSTDEYWAEFSSQFKPSLHETVVIGDRSKAAQDLIERLLGSPESILIGAETAEDVAAFTVAAIRNSEIETRVLLESRTLVVRTEAAARELSTKSGLIFITMKDAEKLAGKLGEKCPTVAAATGTLARKYQPLQRASASSMAEGFEKMGLDREQGYELAHRCGRSLTILKRLIPNVPPAQPEWLQHVAQLKAAFLAGGWSANVSMDRQLLQELGNYKEYSEFDSVILPTLGFSDPPIDRVADAWQVRAPVDAFFFYGQQLTDGDLARLRDAIIKVFSHVGEQPTRDEKFTFGYTAPADYSRWLRDGLALTLLIIAAMHDAIALHINGKSPQQYVDEIVAALPDWGKKHGALLRLGDQTALIAEAAPNPFLTALESIFEGSHEELAKIFTGGDSNMFGPPSTHVRILWGLETIAWDPRHLNRVVTVLARLAELDPDPESNHVNRPINSLKTILLGWSPSTYAKLGQRIACLDLVIKASKKVGWQLLVKLLPKFHDTSVASNQPKIRDLAPKIHEPITFGVVWDFEAQVVMRAIAHSGDDEDRISLLIVNLGSYQLENRKRVLDHIDTFLTRHQTAEGCKIWHSLRDEASRHGNYADSDWAMKPGDRALLDEIVDRHRPTDPLAEDRQLFDDWMPNIGKDVLGEGQLPDYDEYRKAAIDKILKRNYVPEILRLSRLAKLPELIGPALQNSSISIEQALNLLLGALSDDVPRSLRFQVSAVGAQKFGNSWTELFGEYVLPLVDNNAEKARLMLGWPLNEDTWSFVKNLGPDVEEQYWHQNNILPTTGTDRQLFYAIDRFRELERHVDVLCFIHGRLSDLPTELLQDLLVKGASHLETAVNHAGTMLQYYITKAITELRTRDKVNELEVARVEYSYLPILDFNEQPQTIVGLMAKDAELYVDILTKVFRAKSAAPEEEVSAENRVHARTSHQLLMRFKLVPGLIDGKVDAEVLGTWVSKARQLARANDREEVCDIYIGHVLAYSPSDPVSNSWPAAAVCEVIESTASDALQRGFTSECFNKRGVYSKNITEGGGQERALADQYQRWADQAHQYPRTAAMLESIAERWRHDAEIEDTRAEQRKMKW